MSASALSSENTVKKIYQTVIDEVLENIREAFLDEGYDETVLHELKQMWETKLNASRAIQTAEEAAKSSDTSSNLRLPVAHKETRGSGASVASSTASGQQSSDLKHGGQMIDPATRAALQALPQSLFSSSTNMSGQEMNPKMKKQLAAQLDGGVDGGSSDEDDDENDIVGSIHGDDDDDDDKINDDPSEYEGKEDSDPLNSEDDLTEPGSPNSNSDLFDTEHVIVCQYDKVT